MSVESTEEHSLLPDIESPLPENSPFIDVYMLPCKLAYLFLDALIGCYVFYIVVFLTSLGLDVKEAGFISGIRLISSAIAAPICGYLSDYTGHRKAIFVILVVGTLVTVTPMPWIGRALSPSASTAVYPTTIGNLSASTHTTETTRDAYQPFANKLFYGMLSIAIISSTFYNSINGILDSFITNVVKFSPVKTTYGQQRWIGALGFAATNFLAGYLADHYNYPSMSPYTAIFFPFVLCGVLLIPTGLVVASQANWETPQKGTTISKRNKTKLLLSTLQKIDNLLFIISVFVCGVGNAITTGYLFQLMQDKLHAPNTILGLGNSVAGLTELLIFLFGHRIIRFVGGTIPSIQLAMLAFAARFIIVTYITNAWLLLPIQILNSFSFSLFWVAAIEHNQQITAKEIYFTMYSIVASTYYSVAGLCGFLLGGIIYSSYSGDILFRGAAVICVAWVVVMAIYFQGIVGIRRHFGVTRQPDETTPLIY